jgi:hypothetical protein
MLAETRWEPAARTRRTVDFPFVSKVFREAPADGRGRLQPKAGAADTWTMPGWFFRRASKSLLLGAALLLFACSGSRFPTPYSGPGGPPFISPKAHSLWRHASALSPRVPTYRVILIGDAGANRPEEATLSDLGYWADEGTDRTTVVFLGDNLYPSGLEEDDERGEGILLQQLRATRAHKIFVPGNHDWGNVIPDVEKVGNQERFIESFEESPATFMPKGGCPGPEIETLVEPGAGLSRGLYVMAIDLDWWLLDPDERPACPGIANEGDFLRQVGRELRALEDGLVIVAGHHPLRTGGPHGGYGRGWWTERGIAIATFFGATIQDLDAERYRRMVRQLVPALATQRPLIYAAGHDHNLQVIEGRDTAGTLVVSGAGSAGNVTTTTAIAGTLFAHAFPGFVIVDFYGGTEDEKEEEDDAEEDDAPDRAMLRVIEAGHPRPVFEMELPTY